MCFTTKLYVRSSSSVPPLAPFIFCGRAVAVTNCKSPAHKILTLDGWLRIKVPADVVPTLLGLRTQIDQLIERSVLRARGGGNRGAATRSADERAALDALSRSICALLIDAHIMPLPPKPKPAKSAKPGKIKGSKSSKKRARARKKKQIQKAEAAPAAVRAIPERYMVT